MARMSLSQAAQSVAGKQPVQPVPLVSEPVYPYAGTRRLSPMPPVPGSNAVRVAPDGTRLSPPPPTPGSNAYRVAPAGTLYDYAGQRDGRAIGVPYGPGAYPVINTHNPTMVVLPPRLDLFSHMQNDYANFYRNIMPLITQMAQRAMQQGAKVARPKGNGNAGSQNRQAQPSNGYPFIPTENVYHNQIPAGGLPALGSYADAARRRGYIRPDLYRNPTASDDYEWYRDNHQPAIPQPMPMPAAPPEEKKPTDSVPPPIPKRRPGEPVDAPRRDIPARPGLKPEQPRPVTPNQRAADAMAFLGLPFEPISLQRFRDLTAWG